MLILLSVSTLAGFLAPNAALSVRRKGKGSGFFRYKNSL